MNHISNKWEDIARSGCHLVLAKADNAVVQDQKWYLQPHCGPHGCKACHLRRYERVWHPRHASQYAL